MKLACATWNIKGGGTGAGDAARLRRLMALLAGLGLSAAAIQECKYWDRGNFRTFHLAECLLGMRGFLCPSAHHGCHLAVFIREDAGLRVTEQRHEQGGEWWHSVACVLVEARATPADEWRAVWANDQARATARDLNPIPLLCTQFDDCCASLYRGHSWLPA
jgi:hypothetical protein